MPLKPLADLPSDSRLWSFGCGRALTADEEVSFLHNVDTFLEGWQAHGHPLDAGREWRDGRFLLVAVDEATAPPSGCSIDALVHALKGEESRLGTELVGNAWLWYRAANDELVRTTRAGFAEAAAKGQVDANTYVFDFTVTRLGAVREGAWETRAGDSWHARAFRLSD